MYKRKISVKSDKILFFNLLLLFIFCCYYNIQMECSSCTKIFPCVVFNEVDKKLSFLTIYILTKLLRSNFLQLLQHSEKILFPFYNSMHILNKMILYQRLLNKTVCSTTLIKIVFIHKRLFYELFVFVMYGDIVERVLLDHKKLCKKKYIINMQVHKIITF